MKKLEKIIAGIALGVTILTSAVNVNGYVDTSERLVKIGQRYSAESERLARKELQELEGNFNQFKLGYRLSLQDHLDYCEDAKNVGII